MFKRAVLDTKHIGLRHLLTMRPMVGPKRNRVIVHNVYMEQKILDVDFSIEFFQERSQ